MVASRQQQILLRRGIQVAIRPMVKAPVVSMNMGRLCGAEVIKTMTGTAESTCGTPLIKNREPAAVGAVRLSVSVSAGGAAVRQLGPDGHGSDPVDQDTASYR